MKLQFIRQSKLVELDAVAPTRMLLDLLREDLHISSCKEGCAEGDCGACTVVTAGLDPWGEIEYKAVNACIKLASSVQGMAVWSAQDIAQPAASHAELAALHPVQQAMIANHASQCGFCTPGFVMSLFALYQTQVQQGQPVTREAAQQALSGNLCRCTGYRAISDAAMSLTTDPTFAIDETALKAQLVPLQRKQSLQQFLQARHAAPEAQLVAGTTDVGLWINKSHQQFSAVHDITQVKQLQHITSDALGLHIGAAVTLQAAFAAMQAQRPQLQSFSHRFAGLPVRNSGTLAGNIANGSPIGDSMPLLISLQATVSLARWDGASVVSRVFPIEQLYLGYRKNVLLPDEVVTHIHVPAPVEGEFSRVYKVSKRFEDDISAVCLAIQVRLVAGSVAGVYIGVGGVAAVPARAHQTEASLNGQPWNESSLAAAKTAIQSEFQPISDMRASKAYRQTVLGQLLERFWLETQGKAIVTLDDLAVLEVRA